MLSKDDMLIIKLTHDFKEHIYASPEAFLENDNLEFFPVLGGFASKSQILGFIEVDDPNVSLFEYKNRYYIQYNICFVKDDYSKDHWIVSLRYKSPERFEEFNTFTTTSFLSKEEVFVTFKYLQMNKLYFKMKPETTNYFPSFYYFTADNSHIFSTLTEKDF